MCGDHRRLKYVLDRNYIRDLRVWQIHSLETFEWKAGV